MKSLTDKLNDAVEGGPLTQVNSVFKCTHLISLESGKTDCSVFVPPEDLVDRASYDRLREILRAVVPLVGATRNLTLCRHVHIAGKNDICAICGKHLIDDAHFRVGEDSRSDIGKAKLLLATLENKLDEIMKEK